MNQRFQVEARIRPLEFRTLTSSQSSQLPDGPTDVSDIRIVRSHGVYVASMEITAPHPSDAKEHAVARIRQFVELLAVNGDAYQLDLGAVDAQVQPQPDDALDGEVFITEHVALALKRDNLDFEARVLEKKRPVAPHLGRALELNYLSACASVQHVAFVLQAACLELLAWHQQGAPETLLAQLLTRCGRKRLRRALKRVFARVGTDASSTERLITHVFQTHKQPVAHHLRSYLLSHSVTSYTLDQLKAWWHTRGRLAHGEAIDQATLGSLLGELATATRAALKSELKRHVEAE